MSCTVTCSGYRSVRTACAADPCLATGMCRALWPDVRDCAEWCCENRSWSVFFMVLFFVTGTFALCAAYYVHRLHAINVAAGAVTVDGDVVQVAATSVSASSTAGGVGGDDNDGNTMQRVKRKALVDPQLLLELQKKSGAPAPRATADAV